MDCPPAGIENEEFRSMEFDVPGTVFAVAVPGLLEIRADEVLPLASVGKLLLLAEIARSQAGGELDLGETLDIRADDRCGGSGLLTDLSPRRWTIGDLVRLTAAVSDNTATNVLLRRVGLDQVNQGAASLGLQATRLLDRIREPRLPEHAPTFAVGTARELAGLADRIAGPEPWARTMLGWMAANTDRTMVSAGIPHDSEERDVPEKTTAGHLWLANKTGADAGIRAEVGVVRGGRQVPYAVLGTCPPGAERALADAMRAVGALITIIVS
jgi:beta-lactamase class A